MEAGDDTPIRQLIHRIDAAKKYAAEPEGSGRYVSASTMEVVGGRRTGGGMPCGPSV